MGVACYNDGAPRVGLEVSVEDLNIIAVSNAFDYARNRAESALLDYRRRAEVAEKRAAEVEAMHAAPAAAWDQARAEGAAAERAAVVAWLRNGAEPRSFADTTARAIEDGEHVESWQG